MHILIVDDHTLFRKGLRLILASTAELEATFSEAANAREALRFLNEVRCDLVILDIVLPGRNGLDLLGQIRQQHPDLPVLVVSMYPEEQYAVRALKLGANGYLTKSSSHEDLFAAVVKTAGGGRYISANLSELLAAEVTGNRHGATESHACLSNRELQVACLIATGKTVKDIAAELTLSEKTIGTYRLRLLGKLNLRNSAELTAYCLRNGLVN
jgi:DNA-binding NarL/FixJ family response regulator